MSAEEIDLLPFGFLKKYGTFLQAIDDFQRELKTDASMARGGRFDKIKEMDGLMPNEDKEDLEEWKAARLA